MRFSSSDSSVNSSFSLSDSPFSEMSEEEASSVRISSMDSSFLTVSFSGTSTSLTIEDDCF